MTGYQAVPGAEFNNAVFNQVVIGLIAEPDTPGSNCSGVPDGQVKDAEEITTRKSNNGLVGCSACTGKSHKVSASVDAYVVGGRRTGNIRKAHRKRFGYAGLDIYFNRGTDTGSSEQRATVVSRHILQRLAKGEPVPEIRATRRVPAVNGKGAIAVVHLCQQPCRGAGCC